MEQIVRLIRRQEIAAEDASLSKSDIAYRAVPPEQNRRACLYRRLSTAGAPISPDPDLWTLLQNGGKGGQRVFLCFKISIPKARSPQNLLK